MEYFLRSIVETSFVPNSATGLPSKELLDLHLLLFTKDSCFLSRDAIATRIVRVCEGMLTDSTLSDSLRKDVSRLATIYWSLPRPSEAIWSLRDDSLNNQATFQNVIPPKLACLFWVICPIFADNLFGTQVTVAVQGSVRQTYEAYYGAAKQPEIVSSQPTSSPTKVPSVWRDTALEITKSLMTEKNLSPALVQKVANLFAHEAAPSPDVVERLLANPDVDAKWRDYVVTYFHHYMKRTFDLEFASAVFREACAEAQNM